jgi:hypothetical protein
MKSFKTVSENFVPFLNNAPPDMDTTHKRRGEVIRNFSPKPAVFTAVFVL